MHTDTWHMEYSMSKELDKSYQKVMDKFDEIDQSMQRTFNAMYFLYGGIVAVMIISLVEAFTSWEQMLM